MTDSALFHALHTDSPDEIEAWCRESVGDDAAVLRVALRRALAGSRPAAIDYVRAWRSLSETLLAQIHMERPDLVAESEGALRIVDVDRAPGSLSSFVLEIEALSAPFSPWVARTNDLGTGSCAALLQNLRTAIRGLRPVRLDAPALPHLDVSAAQLDAFRRNVTRALSRDEQDLDRIQHIFDLNITELGRLFGVTRQAVTQWQSTQVPAARREKVATVGSVADLLESRLKTDRIPGVVRRSAPAYRGLTILGMIEENQQDAVLEQVRSSFDWAVPA